MTRDKLKDRFFADILAKRKANEYGAEYPSDVENVFKDLFPTVYHFIRHINCYGWEHANLIRALQRRESRFVIECVAASLLDRYPYMFLITLHDAIYSTPGDIPRVVDAFKEGFDTIGFQMSYKVEG